VGGEPESSPSRVAQTNGAVSDALWAVDGANVSGFANEDRGSGTADLQITANLAVRGLSGFVLRVNYIVFHFPS
jgi:hypothetical protein